LIGNKYLNKVKKGVVIPCHKLLWLHPGSLVSIGLVLSEEKIFEKVYDVRRQPFGSGELKKLMFKKKNQKKKGSSIGSCPQVPVKQLSNSVIKYHSANKYGRQGQFLFLIG
jgi:hypothetical protein